MLKKQLVVLIAVFGILPSLPVHAEQNTQDSAPVDKRWYIAPFGRLTKSGGNQDGDDGWGGGIAVGKKINKHFNVEAKGFYEGFGNGYHDVHGVQIGQKLTPRQDLRGGSIDAQYNFNRNTFSPYTVVGVGGMQGAYPANSGDDVLFTAEAGAGFNYAVSDNMSLRSDVRYRYGDNFNSKTGALNDMLVNVGFVVPLGGKPKKAVPPPAMPVEVPIQAKSKPIEDCSVLDSDNDGINDCIDKCPGTLPDSKITADGCPISLELKGVLFEYDSAKLMPVSMNILDKVAQNLISFPQNKEIEVQGHTSSEGSDKYNLKLSQKRSQSVVNYLKSHGVPNRLYAKGYGEKRPVADNDTEIGRSKNRRVELVWMDR